MYRYKKVKRRRKIVAIQEHIPIEKRIFWIFIIVSALIVGLAYIGQLNDLHANGLYGASAWGQAFVFAWMRILRPLYITLSFVFIAIGLFAAVKFWPMRAKVHFREKPTLDVSPKERTKNPKILKQWEAIAARANTRTPENIRLAVMEADALVDYFLKDAGYEGDHMADRLGKIRSSEIKSLERVWRAHRVRNDIAHTPGYRLGEKQAQETLTAFRDFLIEMGAL